MLKTAILTAKQVLNKYKRNTFNHILLISEICKSENIEIDTFPMRNSHFAGMLWKEKDQYFILCNSRLAATRRLFTIAHELGHYFLHRSLQQSFTCQTIFGQSSDIREHQANFFAAELLMPAEIMLQYIKSMTSVKKISRDLDVSEEAVRYRIKQLMARYLF